MERCARIVFLAPLTVFVGVCLAAWAAERDAEKPSAPPPLKVDQSAPLLLDGGPGKDAKKAAGTGQADNAACFVCHGNYRGELLAGVHAQANVGCVKCHGDSFAHRSDENNVTPPDTMYAPAEIAPACAKCHDTHNAPAAKIIARWQEKCPAKTNPADLVCTDCHGEHRMKFRTVWWDKKTRKLVVRQKDEQVKMAPDLTKKPTIKAGRNAE